MVMTTVTRAAGESDVDLMSRAAEVAQKVSGYVDGGNGPACTNCAPFSTPEGDTVEIRTAGSCYNCGE
jgi:hypothetical protein